MTVLLTTNKLAPNLKLPHQHRLALLAPNTCDHETPGLSPTPQTSSYSLHCSSFLGLPFGILNINMVKPKKGTIMETIGNTKNRKPQSI